MIKSINTTQGAVVIREASLADVEQFQALRLNALQDSPIAFSSDYQTTLNQTKEYWQDRLKNDEYSILFLAEHDQHLIGMTGIMRGHSPKTQHSANIWGVYMRPEWRGFHIAQGLIDICCEWAKLHKVQIVKLAVVSTNESAIRLYKRSGFTVYGTEPRALMHEDRYYDEFFMSRSLTDS